MRILLARALAVEASMLLADEPIAALDPLHQLQVMTLLRANARQLFFFDGPQLFSIAQATQEGCVMFLRKTRRWMWAVDKLLCGYFWP